MVIKTIFRKDKEYPENLKTIDTPPERLFLLGTLKKQDQKAIAIVGSRKMSSYGKKQAWRFAFELARKKITIVSGLARGIDTIAHRAALKAGGRTIAVLGSGFNHIYPPENRKLAQAISQNGALISEFNINEKPLAKNFLVRNRLIAGLAKAVLVVEGARKSGTLSTATWAANYNREVFAIPGPIDSPMSQAPHYLIEQGATIAQKPSDIMEYWKHF